MTPGTLNRQYRYSTAWAGPLGEGITIQPVGMDDPREQNRFHTEINLISRLLFGPGAAANTVYNAHGPVIFQHPEMNINRQRAKQVTQEWRRLKRAGVISSPTTEAEKLRDGNLAARWANAPRKTLPVLKRNLVLRGAESQ
jgi:hypothetical protein